MMSRHLPFLMPSWRRSHCALIIGLLVLAVPAAAHSQAEVAANAVSQSPELEKLLGFLINENDVITAATANFDVEFERTFKASGGDAAEARYPGITAVIANAGKQEMIVVLRESFPALRANAAALIGQSLSPQEIDEANVFYGSPTGRKLTQAAVAGARGATMDTLIKSAQIAAVDAMGPEDQAALIALTKTELYPKMAVLGPTLQQSSADWANSVIMRKGGRLQKAVETAGNMHIASLKPKRSR